MSFNSSKRKVLSTSLPVRDRVSDLRACAMEIAHKFFITRNSIIDYVKAEAGIDLHNNNLDDKSILIALEIIEAIKNEKIKIGKP